MPENGGLLLIIEYYYIVVLVLTYQPLDSNNMAKKKMDEFNFLTSIFDSTGSLLLTFVTSGAPYCAYNISPLLHSFKIKTPRTIIDKCML